MPRPQRGYGRPDTPVIPNDWDSSHAVVLDRTHRAHVTIAAAGQPRWDDQQRRTITPTGATVYDGPASLFQRAADDVATAEDQTLVRTFDVALTYGATGLAEHQRLTVVDCPGDTDLEGLVLDVQSVGGSSSRFSRHLTATLAS